LLRQLRRHVKQILEPRQLVGVQAAIRFDEIPVLGRQPGTHEFLQSGETGSGESGCAAQLENSGHDGRRESDCVHRSGLELYSAPFHALAGA
jgi:hypothetical protein